MYVHGASAFICEPVDDINGLKDDLKQYTDFFFRRVNKFILLSLLGVHRCINKKNTAKSIAVYLATENGNLGDTENVLHQLYKENSFPKPFNFINTMSNTASFYIAQSLKSQGRSITVSSKNVSFERGLELAKSDFALKNITEALVGGVDESVSSRDHFMKKYEKAYHDVKLVEGSSWLYLAAHRDGALGKIADIKTFNSRDDAVRWVRSAPVSDPVVLSFGILIPPSEKEIWKKELAHEEEFDYLFEHGYYDTVASLAVSKFFERYTRKVLMYINKNIQGQYVILICARY